MCVRSFASSKRLGLGRSCSCLAVTALFTVGCDCRTDTLDSGTGLALLSVLRKSTTRGNETMKVVPEHRLWSAVILTTVQEWLSGPLRLSRRAEQYLFHDEKDFRMVCQSAGMDPGRLRGQLGRMRRTGLSNQPASHSTLGSSLRRTS